MKITPSNRNSTAEILNFFFDVRSKKKCPQCRAVCHISAEDAHENFMIKGDYLAKRHLQFV